MIEEVLHYLAAMIIGGVVTFAYAWLIDRWRRRG